ncbi:MAG TPA: nitroreductase family protein [Caproicibacter sp.]|nr:nitroreductase family protein [Caproicibacter sp.]
MSKNFFEAVQNRRSYYAIGRTPILSDDEIVNLVEDAVKYTPTAFNSQSGRAAVLLGKDHEKLWEETADILQKIVPDNQFIKTQEKLNAFKAGYGTILFFEDQDVVSELQQKFALYKDNFPIWSLEASGILQFILWTLLEEKGYGASLQHYNPLIDDMVLSNWTMPRSWKLIAQMPFGSREAKPDEKTFQPISGRVKVCKESEPPKTAEEKLF